MPVPNNIPIPGLATDNVDFSDFAGGNPYSQYGPSSKNTPVSYTHLTLPTMDSV